MLHTPAATVHLIHVVKVLACHAKLVCAKTGGLSFPKGSTVAFQPEDRLHELTGLVAEDALIPAEGEVTLMITNPGANPVNSRKHCCWVQLSQSIGLGILQSQWAPPARRVSGVSLRCQLSTKTLCVELLQSPGI